MELAHLRCRIWSLFVRQLPVTNQITHLLPLAAQLPVQHWSVPNNRLVISAILASNYRTANIQSPPLTEYQYIQPDSFLVFFFANNPLPTVYFGPWFLPSFNPHSKPNLPCVCQSRFILAKITARVIEVDILGLVAWALAYGSFQHVCSTHTRKFVLRDSSQLSHTSRSGAVLLASYLSSLLRQRSLVIILLTYGFGIAYLLFWTAAPNAILNGFCYKSTESTST